jgi:hypothetical protein
LGKYGEFGAAAIAFEHFGFPVVEPDCRIYEKGDKSFECDLPFSHFDASLPDAGVKTCDDNTLATTARIGDTYSWLWQYKNKKNPGGLDRLFNDPESMELQFLMYTPKVWHGSITLIATAPWKLLYPLIINRTTVLEGLQSIKRCLYYNDLLAAWTGWSSPLTGQTFLRNGAASADAL